MRFRYRIENGIVMDIHFADTQAGAFWLARWLAARFAALCGIIGAYNVNDLATRPPTRLLSVAWEPRSWAVGAPWPLSWTYKEF